MSDLAAAVPPDEERMTTPGAEQAVGSERAESDRAGAGRSEGSEAEVRASGIRRWVVFLGLAIGVVALDQASKAVIDAVFALASTHGPVAGLAEPTQIIGDWVRIAKSYNDGGLFGLFDAAAPILAVASLFVIGILVVVQARSGPRASWLTTVALGLLLGGAIGNLLDRIRHGYVIDWVDMGIGSWRFYTFNVADSAISIAIVLLLAAAIFGREPTNEAGR